MQGRNFQKKTWQRSQRSQSSQAADAQLPTQEQGVEQDAPVPQKMTKGAALKQGLPPENHGLHFWKRIFEMFTCTPIKKYSPHPFQVHFQSPKTLPPPWLTN